MCDTLLAGPQSTTGRVMLFGKNSDRQRNEAQAVQYFAGGDHSADSTVKCTYITVPQARRTYSVLVCRPFWMWGAEMGANEHGVVIGNEALHARSPAPTQEALTGMDLLRLALERAASASEAIDVLTQLLEQCGQGGNCGHLTPSYYNNGFLVADARSAYVLETVDRDWLIEQVRGVRTMSNRYSIEREALRTSAGLDDRICDQGWSTAAAPNYAEVIADPGREHIGNAGARRLHSTTLLSSLRGGVAASDVMSVLRDHGALGHPHPGWREECVTLRTVCMHAGAEDRNGQTVGSLVSELADDGAVHWVTGTSAPCISIFKPVLMDVPLPLRGPVPTDRFDRRTLWWQHERLHRAILDAGMGAFLEHIRSQRDELEAEFQKRIRSVLSGGDATERGRVVSECWQQALEMERSWDASLISTMAAVPAAHLAAWQRMSQIAGLDVFS